MHSFSWDEFQEFVKTCLRNRTYYFYISNDIKMLHTFSLNVKIFVVFCSFAIIMFGSFDVRMKNCGTNGSKWNRWNMHWKTNDYNYSYYTSLLQNLISWDLYTGSKTISYINILNLNSFQITQQPFHCFTGTTFEHFWILYIYFLHKYLVLTFNVDLTLNSLKVP